MSERIKAEVYTPARRPHPRNGRGFSVREIREAGLTPYEAKRLGISIDVRRKTSHVQNIRVLKEEYGTVVQLTEIRGIGEATERKLIDADIVDGCDLANANLDELSRKVSYSKKTLQKWQVEAKKLLKE